ncbi:MAG: penicillin-binding protein 2 [Deltaproteobacteria bacterium]|nr:MAG: penicillin-binding protein 2 [Deltaproteobacteria bacterium]
MSPLRPLSVSDGNGERLRFQVAMYLVVVVFVGLLLRLWYLQLIHGETYRSLSEHNRIRIEDIAPTRGIIYDRYGRILVDNRPAFKLAIVPEDVSDLQQTLFHLSQILGVDRGQLSEKIQGAPKGAPFRPIVLRRDMTRDQLAAVESHRFHLPGVMVQIEPRRSYERPSFAAHLIGYLGEIEEAQLKDRRPQGYKLGDYLGKYGVEMEWEGMLKGKRGGRQVEADAMGRQLRILREVSSRPGRNLVLALDARLQHRAEAVLEGKAGAIIVLDPDNGDILAMASSPAFDQNQFVRGFSSSEWQAIVGDPLHPLENKGIQGQYPPGSTFKPVVVAAALEEGVVEPGTVLNCQGEYRLGNRTYRCWKKEGHGQLALREALVQSCDVYFYQLGQMLGVDRMASYARLFGLDSRTQIRLNNEARGLVPTSQWKLKRYSVPWQKGEDLNVAIGQGFLLATPIQIGMLYGAIGNGGKFLRPRVVLRVEDTSGRLVHNVYPDMLRKLALRPATLSFLQEALVGVIQEPYGTGRAAQLHGIKMAGKTGTAQVVRMADDEEEQDASEVPYEFRDHAWFVAYAPAETPEILVVVLVEHGGHGASAAAPLARQVMEEYFKSRPRVKTAQSSADSDKPALGINQQAAASGQQAVR